MPCRTSPSFTALSLLALATAAPAAEVGRAAFDNHCRTCHSMKEDDHRLGPSLYRIFGAKAAAARGYSAYSQSLIASEIVWDEATLDAFIANPEAVVANNSMKPYTGMTDSTVRMEIVEYLKAMSYAR